MTKPETDAEFLKRIVAHRAAHGVVGWLETDWPRLLRLAERGAKVPDEPTEAMKLAGSTVGEEAARWDESLYVDEDRGACLSLTGAAHIYRAMLAVALKGTDND